MGRKVENKESENAKGGALTISLFGPGMTVMHKVGLAGLWMTLKALEEENGGVAAFPDGTGSWQRSESAVTLRWNADADACFKWLFKESFRIDKHGLIWFPALGEPMQNPQHAVVLQEAVLGSFLQHGRTRKADPSQKPGGAITFDIDGELHPLKFHRLTRYSHQHSAFSPAAINAVAGWLFPGGVVRHTGLGQETTAIEESPDRALALRFALVGAIYFNIHRRGGGMRPQYALVLPDIQNLATYSQARECFLKYSVQQLYASGMAEAGFRFLAQLQAAGLLADVQSTFCHVVSFGIAPWSKQQKSRLDIMMVRAKSQSALRIFNLCCQVLAPRFVKLKTGVSFWDIPQFPDLVATNLNEGRCDWWSGFGDFAADSERGKHIFDYEKGGIATMVDTKEAFPDGPERTFVLACHEAWRRRMGQISDKAKREGSNFSDQVGREFERIRVSFSRCKNAASLREAVTDFWSRSGGPVKPLQDGWHDVLTLLDEANWRKGRDLALLALASYKPATKEEAKALENTKTEGENKDE